MFHGVPMYLYLTSDNTIYQDNRPDNFAIRFSSPIILRGQWEVGLVDITGYPSVSSVYYLFSDLCETNFVNSDRLPVLRRFLTNQAVLNTVFNPVAYVPVCKSVIEGVRIYIKDVNLQDHFDLKKVLHCTLHLRPI